MALFTMKSLLVSAFAAMGVLHGGAFLTVWEVPYVEGHLTYQDFGRKLNKVFKVDEAYGALRKKREEVREENEAIFAEDPGEPLELSNNRGYRGSSTTAVGSQRY